MFKVYLPPSSKFLLLHQPSWNFLTVLQIKNNNIFQPNNVMFSKDINLPNTNIKLNIKYQIKHRYVH